MVDLVALERALERLTRAFLDAPATHGTRPGLDIASRVSRQPDASLRVWREPTVDWHPVLVVGLHSLQTSADLDAARRIIRQGLNPDVDPIEAEPHAEEWEPTPGWAVARRFLEIYLDKAREVAWSPDAFRAAFAAVTAFLMTDRVVQHIVAPLDGFGSDVDEIRLSRVARVRRITDAELSSWWSTVHESPLPGPGSMTISQWSFVLDVEKEVGSIQEAGRWVDMQELVAGICTALRILRPGSVAIQTYRFEFEEPVSGFGEVLGLGGGRIAQPVLVAGRGAASYTISRDETAALPTVAARVLAAKGDPVFGLMARRYEASYDRLRDEDRLIDHFVAFEAGFLRRGEHQMGQLGCNRVAAFLETNTKERRRLRRDLVAAYQRRCDVVHGDPTDTAAIRSAADCTQATLRRCLFKWIDPRISHAVDDLDPLWRRTP